MNTDFKHQNQIVDFSLSTVRGGSGILSQHLVSKQGAVIVFWSSICSHCARYDAYLNEFENRNPGIALLVVAARKHESRSQLLITLSQRNLDFSLLHDADRALAHQWFVRQTPTAFLVDANRQLVYRGAIDNFKYPQDPDHEPYLDAAIKALLAGRAPTRTETTPFGCPIQSIYYTLPKPLGR